MRLSCLFHLSLTFSHTEPMFSLVTMVTVTNVVIEQPSAHRQVPMCQFYSNFLYIFREISCFSVKHKHTYCNILCILKKIPKTLFSLFLMFQNPVITFYSSIPDSTKLSPATLVSNPPLRIKIVCPSKIAKSNACDSKSINKQQYIIYQSIC